MRTTPHHRPISSEAPGKGRKHGRAVPRSIPARLLRISTLAAALVLSAGSVFSAETEKTVTVPFAISPTGHLVVKAIINGHSANLILDTGSGACVIHSPQVEKLGLTEKKGSMGMAAGLGTSAHAVVQVEPFTLTIEGMDFKVTDFVATDLSNAAQATGDQEFHGLLGMTLLVKYKALIDYDKRTITLRTGESAVAIKIQSPAFAANAPIPKKHTGEGPDVSPPLAWEGVPPASKEIALICDDPDAPRSEPWVHWVLYKIPATSKGLPEGLAARGTLTTPPGALNGTNDFGKIGYGGPMPPKGHGTHHYRFRIYALDAALILKPGVTKQQLLTAMKGHVLAEGELVGTYERK